MNTSIISSGTRKEEPTRAGGHENPNASPLRNVLLLCGILSPLLYMSMSTLLAIGYDGYHLTTHTVSELSAIGAPTRPLWQVLMLVYTALAAAFGWGIVRSAGQNRRLCWAGRLMLVYVAISLFWPPMHQRDVLAAGGKTLTDTLHIAFAAVTIPLMLLILGFGAAALGKGFRIYSVVTIGVLLVFGVLTGLDSPRMEANLATPWMGIRERICIGAFMLWLSVLAVILLRRAPVGGAGHDAFNRS